MKLERVHGFEIPAARLTREALWLFLSRIGLPLLAVLFALDVILWAIARAFGSCYGVLCLF